MALRKTVQKNSRFKQGYYELRNPSKYIGEGPVRYMSSWELSFNGFLDNNPNILRWSSEEIGIPYIKPTTGKVHKYYPDYFIEYKNKAGVLIRKIVEVKPLGQTKRSRSKKPKNKLYEDIQYSINMAKWAAAKQFCDNHGMFFEIITEKQLFG